MSCPTTYIPSTLNAAPLDAGATVTVCTDVTVTGAATSPDPHPTHNRMGNNMLVTLGFIALLIAIVLIVCGYTVAPQALRPGWGCFILAIILLVLGYLLPALDTDVSQPNANPASIAIQP